MLLLSVYLSVLSITYLLCGTFPNHSCGAAVCPPVASPVTSHPQQMDKSAAAQATRSRAGTEFSSPCSSFFSYSHSQRFSLPHASLTAAHRLLLLLVSVLLRCMAMWSCRWRPCGAHQRITLPASLILSLSPIIPPQHRSASPARVNGGHCRANGRPCLG